MKSSCFLSLSLSLSLCLVCVSVFLCVRRESFLSFGRPAAVGGVYIFIPFLFSFVLLFSGRFFVFFLSTTNLVTYLQPTEPDRVCVCLYALARERREEKRSLLCTRFFLLSFAHFLSLIENPDSIRQRCVAMSSSLLL